MSQRQSIVFEGPSNLFPKRLRLDDKSNEKHSDTVHQWILSSLTSLELLIVRIINDEVDLAKLIAMEKKRSAYKKTQIQDLVWLISILSAMRPKL